MKILFYNDHQFLTGGAETYWRETASRLKIEGIDVCSLSFESGNAATPEESGRRNTVTSLSKAGASALLRETIDKFKPDVIHLNNHSRYVDIIGEILRKIRIPVVATVHDYYSVPFPINFKNRLKALFGPRHQYCSNFIIPSRYYYNLLKQKKIGGLKYIPHFIDLKKWPFNDNYDEKGLKLLFVGRLEKIKGVDILINAVKTLSTRFPSLHLTIIGEGSESHRLQNLVAENGLSGSVTMTGPIEQELILQYFHQSSILVVPSVKDEMLGLVGPEAQASGIPVVACNVAGIREWCRHGETGLLVPPGDPALLAHRLELLIEKPKMRNRLRYKARAFVEQRFSGNHTIGNLIRYYHQLAEK